MPSVQNDRGLPPHHLKPSRPRGLGQALTDGTFINVWQGLYSESFAQRSNARGYDRIIVAEPTAYKTIMDACPETISYSEALT